MTRHAAAVMLLGALVGCSALSGAGAASLAAQESAIAFLANQHDRSQPVCVHVATRPGDLVQGLVRNDLADPPPGLVGRLANRGLKIQPFSTCDLGKGRAVVLAVGWPSPSADGFEVPVDRLCGALGCDRGYLVHVKKTGDGWRAVGARSTWVS